MPDDREPAGTARTQDRASRAAPNSANRESFGFLLTREQLGTSGDTAALSGSSAARATDERALTRVTVVWRAGVSEEWLRFGNPVAARVIDRHVRTESYAPGQCFALVRWAGNAWGTQRSSLRIVVAPAPGAPCSPLPGIEPGGEVLLAAVSWTRAARVLRLIDTVEAAGFDPCTVAPDYWRHAHNRLAADLQPRGYAPDRHRAWHLRRALQP